MGRRLRSTDDLFTELLSLSISEVSLGDSSLISRTSGDSDNGIEFEDEEFAEDSDVAVGSCSLEILIGF